MRPNIENHPCFDPKAAGKFGRVHLPVAPKCNVQCNYCNRKYDCVNESRPGVCSAVLSPMQAMEYLKNVTQRDGRISVVGIAGPGDPMACADETIETLRLVRNEYPDMVLCASSNGLAVPDNVERLDEVGLSHMTLTINAVDPEIGSEVYAWVRHNKKVYRKLDAAKLMLEKQMESIKLLKDRGIIVKVNTIVIPGINDHHIVDIANAVSEAGADLMNCIPLHPTADTAFADMEEPTAEYIHALRGEAGKVIKQMTHCQRCRADACGLLEEGISDENRADLEKCAAMSVDASEKRTNVAVATREGALINEHLGQAEELAIYTRTPDGTQLLETRKTPPAGGDNRWAELAGVLYDCKAVVACAAGGPPTLALKEHGVKVVLAEGFVEDVVEAVFDGKTPRAPVAKKGGGCSGGCTGTREDDTCDVSDEPCACPSMAAGCSGSGEGCG